MNNDLLEVLKYLKQKEVCVTLYTNGLILDEEKIQSVKPYIDNIRFSILGGASTHDSLTQHTGSFEKVLSGIRLAKTFSIPVVATMPVLKKNISELIETVLLCESEGVEKFYIYSLMNRGRAKDLHGHQHISYNKINAELVLAKELLEKNLAKLEVGLVDWDVSGQCVLVYPTGDVLAVINGHNNEGTIKLGNLNEDSAKDLWEKYPFKEEYLAYYKKR